MAPTTRSTPVVEKSDDNASEITLADVMQSLNTIIANQIVHTEKISDLDNRMTAIENVVFTDEKKDVRKAPTSRTSHDEPSSSSIEPGQRDPLTMPGKPGSTFTKSRTFMAPYGSPGPRGPNNLLIFSEPHVDRESRKSWPAHNLNSAYIQWLWTYWCELIAESDLLISHLDCRNGNKPFRSGLRPINKTSDIGNLSLLHLIQATLVQEGTFYELWPQRVQHLFQGDFAQVRSFCMTHRPTWPMTVEAILQILHLSNNLRSPVDAFVAFRSGFPLQSQQQNS
ncbi:hypothetical protein GcC1_183031 [Golovinomyces cichoracearum]|uniref:Uncharacterized protein n=1 Tax=Golovinomyces cichoracearum TaxID=62708 RepID=A0A420HLK1_9PEZI|nr:hypothetical protein GcC1_183031 [Golovinomyces cichoracearum]